MRMFLAVVALLLVGGCAVEPTKPQEWKETPFARVRVAEEVYGRLRADVWVIGELGDKVVAKYRDNRSGVGSILSDLYVQRKDGTRWALSIEVHPPGTGEAVRIRCVHLTVKGREVDFVRL